MIIRTVFCDPETGLNGLGSYREYRSSFLISKLIKLSRTKDLIEQLFDPILLTSVLLCRILSALFFSPSYLVQLRYIGSGSVPFFPLLCLVLFSGAFFTTRRNFHIVIFFDCSSGPSDIN